MDDEFNVYYLYNFLKYKEKHIMSLRVGSGLPNIQKKDLINFKIYYPLIEEQNKIANFLFKVDKKIDLIQDQIDKMEEFKKGLLQQMFEFLLFAFLFLIFCKYLCDSNPIVYLCAIFRFIFNLIINLKFQLILVFPIGLKIYIKIK